LQSERAAVGSLALPRVDWFWRATSILLTSGALVLVGKFDLFAYFRQHGKQRAAVHQSGRSLESLIRFDERINFGEQDGMDHCCRGSEALCFFVRAELKRLQQEYPPADPNIVAWLKIRESIEKPPDEKDDPLCRFTAVWFFMIFVDDAGLAAISYPLLGESGRPLLAADGVTPRRSADMMLQAAAAICQRYGHGTPDKKFFPMGRSLELLGDYGDLDSGLRTLPEGKATRYATDITELLASASAMPNGTTAVDDRLLKSIVHKLLHTITFYPIGRTKLFHMRKCRKSEALLVKTGRIISNEASCELKWWAKQLERADTPSIPLAPRFGFPTSSITTIVSYTDASRELDSPETSGYGGWAIVYGIFLVIYGLWSMEEMELYSINVLEAHANSFCAQIIHLRARQLGNAATHSLSFIDNTTAESIFENGRPQTDGLHQIYERRVAWGISLNAVLAADRITSEDNVVADRLSRAEIKAACAFAVHLGLPIERLYPSDDIRSMSWITPTWPKA
jgi:hypothetical protein